MLDIVEQAGAIPQPLIEQLMPIFLSGITLENQPVISEAFSQSLATLPTENIASIVAIGRSIFKRKDRMPLLSQLKMPVLAEAGHISALEQAKEVNKLLRAFL